MIAQKKQEKRKEPPDLDEEETEIEPPDLNSSKVQKKEQNFRFASSKCEPIITDDNSDDMRDTDTTISCQNASDSSNTPLITVKTNSKDSNTSLNSNQFSHFKLMSNPLFVKGIEKLDSFSEKIKLDSYIIEKAKDNLKLAYEMKKFQGRSITALIISIIYSTSKQCGVPMNFKDLVKDLKISKEEKYEAMRTFNSLKDFIAPNENVTISDITINLVKKYCENLNIKDNVTNTCIEVAENICRKGLIEGRLPNTVASAAIFYVICAVKNCYFEVLLDKIGGVSNVCKTTIASAYFSLKEKCKSMKDLQC
jgi:transcription initiation factor TFIIIB Brf1 subunit/transcription initiation factor TFIIB